MSSRSDLLAMAEAALSIAAVQREVAEANYQRVSEAYQRVWRDQFNDPLMPSGPIPTILQKQAG